jgi:hypothetical protein
MHHIVAGGIWIGFGTIGSPTAWKRALEGMALWGFSFMKTEALKFKELFKLLLDPYVVLTACTTRVLSYTLPEISVFNIVASKLSRTYTLY